MITKEYLFEKIKESEKLAAEVLPLSFEMEMEEINKKAISPKHRKKMLATYMNKALQSYENLRNYYKSCLESFEYIIQPNVVIEDTDRRWLRQDFISSMLFAMTKEKYSDPLDQLKHEDFIRQLSNIDQIIMDTLELKYKSELITNFLKGAEDLKNQKATSLSSIMSEEHFKILDSNLKNKLLNKNGSINGTILTDGVTENYLMVAIGVKLKQLGYTQADQKTITQALSDYFGTPLTDKSYTIVKQLLGAEQDPAVKRYHQILEEVLPG